MTHEFLAGCSGALQQRGNHCRGMMFEPTVGSDFASDLKYTFLSAWDAAAAAHPAETKVGRLKQVAGNVRGKG